LNSREEILKEIIEGYRKVLFKRYQYENIRKKFEIPDTIDKKTVDGFRTYYLTYVYPEYSKRATLNNAFKSLDNYSNKPQKLISILLDTSKLIFKYGLHLPKILKTGFKALKTFKAAENFETTFVNTAVEKNINPPFDNKKFNILLKALSKKEINDFIETSQALFNTLHDKKLVKKIKEIIQHLINVMKSKPNYYSKNQIKGLEIGFELLNEGDKLFNKLTKQDQKKLIYLITDIERDMLDQIK
jgi:hypothetical protein